MIKLNIIKQIFYIHIFYKIITLNSNNFITKNSIISNNFKSEPDSPMEYINYKFAYKSLIKYLT